MTGIIGTIIIGFIVGVLAKLLHPGKENMGFILTTLLGVGGSMLATYAGQALGIYQGRTAGFIGAVVGAVVILVVYGMVAGKGGGGGGQP
jgi:uncharacterized membrane protein YeaQ/YmgE (transglycosylase-associated protein family)